MKEVEEIERETYQNVKQTGDNGNTNIVFTIHRAKAFVDFITTSQSMQIQISVSFNRNRVKTEWLDSKEDIRIDTGIILELNNNNNNYNNNNNNNS